MRDSIRLRLLQKKRSPPRKKETRHQPPPQAQSQAEQQANKPLDQNDLVKWIVISDAPDYAAAESQWRNSKNFPVMARHPTYLDRFHKRDLRLGLKCLRAMNECAQQENARLEKEAEALGAAAWAQMMERSGGAEEADAASSMQFDTPMVDRSEKSLVVVLHFKQSFYQDKVLPLIQEAVGLAPQAHSPRTPSASGNIKHKHDLSRQHDASKTAYNAAATKPSPSPSAAESDPAVQEFPPTPAGYADGDDASAAAANAWQMETATQHSQQTSGFAAANANRNSRSPTPSECPPTPRAPDYCSSSPGAMPHDDVATSSLVPLDPMAMDVDVDVDVGAVGEDNDDDDDDDDDDGAGVVEIPARTDTPMGMPVATATTATTPSISFSSPALSKFQPTSNATPGLPLARPPPPFPSSSSSPFPFPVPQQFSTPQQSLRRSTRSTECKTDGASQQVQQQHQTQTQQKLPVEQLSVWQLQREILRLCAERETTRARNEVLREWMGGVRSAAAGAGVGGEVERMDVDG
ncbi:hypothetical protein IWZ00DRAFT_493011 [Phyllosticta capitalensis]